MEWGFTPLPSPILLEVPNHFVSRLQGWLYRLRLIHFDNKITNIVHSIEIRINWDDSYFENYIMSGLLESCNLTFKDLE